VSKIETTAALLAALFLAAPVAAEAADVIALLPVTGVNVDAGTLAAAGEVMRGHLQKVGLQVRMTSSPTPDQEATPAEAAASAHAAGAGRAAVVRLVLLGTSLRGQLTVYDLSGKQVHADQMAATSVNDLDPVLERLAVGYAKGSTAAKSADIDTVTEKEAAGIKKAEAASAFGVQLGGLRASNTLDAGVSATGGGVYWFYDTRKLFIDVSIEGYWAKGTHHIASGFGGYLPLTKGTFAPYAGAGLRYAWTDYDHGGGHGFQPYVAAGLLLGRLSSVSLRGQLEWWWNTFSNDGKNANGAVWSLGVQF
jgi:hypothetical protein